MGPVILTIVISFWISTVKGSCPGSYYHCTGYSWCCPRGYSCTGTSRCYESSSSGGAIAGGNLGGIVLIAVVCSCISAAVRSKS
ncbi:uncharacterized protein LOC127737260 isoform X9 [Mytilus californianus]|uniref:uncharacterized protein LOC127737260 isoform X8 n=1 Tax=Mytilus californianus TaxID=6549 RepID=UPI0022473133|nr:uncharacterized protein LOC127737260 isoform X8 [Mytilus californianus]XP_052103777.1 uncharacterized protein LOC127737260 isoform X9 [Mytilus californianus]